MRSANCNLAVRAAEHSLSQDHPLTRQLGANLAASVWNFAKRAQCEVCHCQAKGWVMERAPRFGLSPKVTELAGRRSHRDGTPALAHLSRASPPVMGAHAAQAAELVVRWREPPLSGVLHPIMPNSGRLDAGPSPAIHKRMGQALDGRQTPLTTQTVLRWRPVSAVRLAPPGQGTR